MALANFTRQQWLTAITFVVVNFCNAMCVSMQVKKWYFVTKIVLTYCEKKCSTDQEKLLKFEAEGRESANSLRSLEQLIQTVKGQNNFW